MNHTFDTMFTWMKLLAYFFVRKINANTSMQSRLHIICEVQLFSIRLNELTFNLHVISRSCFEKCWLNKLKSAPEQFIARNTSKPSGLVWTISFNSIAHPHHVLSMISSRWRMVPFRFGFGKKRVLSCRHRNNAKIDENQIYAVLNIIKQ